MLDPIVPPRDQAPSERQFGLTIAGVLVAFAIWQVVHHRPVRMWVLGVAAAFSVVALAAPRWLERPNQLLVAVGRVVQRVVGPIVLAIAYFVVLTPTAIVMRRLGLDALRRRRDRAAATYWIERPSRILDRAALRRPY